MGAAIDVNVGHAERVICAIKGSSGATEIYRYSRNAGGRV